MTSVKVSNTMHTAYDADSMQMCLQNFRLTNQNMNCYQFYNYSGEPVNRSQLEVKQL
jgi:hypothetical protein